MRKDFTGSLESEVVSIFKITLPWNSLGPLVFLHLSTPSKIKGEKTLCINEGVTLTLLPSGSH